MVLSFLYNARWMEQWTHCADISLTVERFETFIRKALTKELTFDALLFLAWNTFISEVDMPNLYLACFHFCISVFPPTKSNILSFNFLVNFCFVFPGAVLMLLLRTGSSLHTSYVSTSLRNFPIREVQLELANWRCLMPELVNYCNSCNIEIPPSICPFT